jgi:hypothetical protein
MDVAFGANAAGAAAWHYAKQQGERAAQREDSNRNKALRPKAPRRALACRDRLICDLES